MKWKPEIIRWVLPSRGLLIGCGVIYVVLLFLAFDQPRWSVAVPAGFSQFGILGIYGKHVLSFTGNNVSRRLLVHDRATGHRIAKIDNAFIPVHTIGKYESWTVSPEGRYWGAVRYVHPEGTDLERELIVGDLNDGKMLLSQSVDELMKPYWKPQVREWPEDRMGHRARVFFNSDGTRIALMISDAVGQGSHGINATIVIEVPTGAVLFQRSWRTFRHHIDGGLTPDGSAVLIQERVDPEPDAFTFHGKDIAKLVDVESGRTLTVFGDRTIDELQILGSTELVAGVVSGGPGEPRATQVFDQQTGIVLHSFPGETLIGSAQDGQTLLTHPGEESNKMFATVVFRSTYSGKELFRARQESTWWPMTVSTGVLERPFVQRRSVPADRQFRLWRWLGFREQSEVVEMTSEKRLLIAVGSGVLSEDGRSYAAGSRPWYLDLYRQSRLLLRRGWGMQFETHGVLSLYDVPAGRPWFSALYWTVCLAVLMAGSRQVLKLLNRLWTWWMR